MTLRTDEELEQALTALAESEGLSKHEVVRRAVLRWAEDQDHRRRIDAIASEAMLDYREALDRLGSV